MNPKMHQKKKNLCRSKKMKTELTPVKYFPLLNFNTWGGGMNGVG